MTVGRLEEFARCLDALPASYQVQARTRLTTQVDQLIAHHRLTTVCGIAGQGVFDDPAFDDIRNEVDQLTTQAQPDDQPLLQRVV